jgi:hypothetical protein
MNADISASAIRQPGREVSCSVPGLQCAAQLMIIARQPAGRDGLPAIRRISRTEG